MTTLLLSLLSTNTAIGVAVGAAVAWLVKWLAGNGKKFTSYEGYAVTAIRLAEKAIPDSTTDKGLARLDYALKLFIEKFTAATGVVPDEALTAQIENWIATIHNALDESGALKKSSDTSLASSASGFIRPRLMARLGFAMLCIALVAPLLSGCSSLVSDKQSRYVLEAYQAYQNAPNTADILVVEAPTNTTAELTLKGFSRVCLSTPVPPKTVLPRDPTVWESLFDTVKTVAPWAAMGWIINSGGISSSTSTSTTTTSQ